MPRPRLTYATAVVLQALDAGFRYGFDIARITRLRPGSVYQILHRLEEARLARARWEDAEAARAQGRPNRGYYALVPSTADMVFDARARYPALDQVPDAVEETPWASGRPGSWRG